MQKLLSDNVFAHVKSPKKAAGRALGTIIEIIGFYLVKAWGHEYEVAIEKPLPEYANQDIVHNVELTFHRNRRLGTIPAPRTASITSTWIYNNSKGFLPFGFTKSTTSRYLIKDGIMKNACTFAYSDNTFANAYFSTDRSNILLYELTNTPFAMFECKRVGVEEGNKKGPQTIEKAKQGSYVARAVSSIQRVRRSDGKIGGAIERNGEFAFYDDYYSLIESAIIERDREILSNFILTVGIISNHGNWFTSGNQNKEMKVLAQSYDWLVFLTDEGLAAFIQDTMNSENTFKAVKTAFERSYEEGKKINRFTKTNIDIDADIALTKYFSDNLNIIESWFNVIAPNERGIRTLKAMLSDLLVLEV